MGADYGSSDSFAPDIYAHAAMIQTLRTLITVSHRNNMGSDYGW